MWGPAKGNEVSSQIAVALSARNQGQPYEYALGAEEVEFAQRLSALLGVVRERGVDG